MAVYDDEKTANDEELRRVAGISRDEEDQIDTSARDTTKKGLGAKALEAAENSTGFAKNNFNKFKGETAALSAAAGAAGNAVPGGPVAAKLLQTFIKGNHAKRNSGIAGVASAALITVVALFSMGTSQPLAFVKIATDMGSMFGNMEDLGDSRLGKVFQHIRGEKNGVPASARTRLGAAGNAVADKYTAKLKASGIEIEYNTSGRISALTVDTNTPEGKTALEKMKQQGIVSGDIKDAGGGKVRVELSTGTSGSAAQRRRAISGMVGALDMNKISTAMATRVLKTRGGVDFHPLKNIARGTEERFSDWKKKQKEERAKRIETGEKANISAAAVPDEDGNVNQSQAGDAEIANQGIEEASSTGKSARARSFAIRGVGVTAIAGTICAVYGLGDVIKDESFQKIAGPLLRFGMEFLTIGNQIMWGGQDTNLEEIGVAYEALYDSGEEDDPSTPDVNEYRPATSFDQATSYRGYLGEDVSSITDQIDAKNPENSKISGYDMPSNARLSSAGELPPGISQIYDIVEAIPGASGTCKVANSAIGGFLLDAAGVVTAGTGIGALFAAGSAVAQNLLMQQIMPTIVGWLSGNVLDVQNALGAVTGNYIAYGTRLASNESAIATGGIALTDSQSAELAGMNKELQLARLENQSIYDKYFNVNNTKSVLSNAAFSVKSTAAGNIASQLSSLVSFSTVKNSLNNILSVKADAANTYDFGFPQYGIDAKVAYSTELDDPFENAEIVEPKLNDLNARYGASCFGLSINPESLTINDERPDEVKSANGVTDYSKIECPVKAGDAEANDPASDFNRYRMYIVDLKTTLAAACYEGTDDNACVQIGMTDPVSTASDTDAGSEASGDLSKEYLEQPSESVACAAGTNDLGVQDGYFRGSLVKIRVCGIPGIPSTDAESAGAGQYSIPGANGLTIVNSKVSAYYLSLAQKAQKDGVELRANSSFRSNARQASLRASLGNLAAPAGWSNHQTGLAVDFRISPGNQNRRVATPPSDPYGVWEWLNSNAKPMGFTSLSDEFWHWEPASVSY